VKQVTNNKCKITGYEGEEYIHNCNMYTIDAATPKNQAEQMLSAIKTIDFNGENATIHKQNNNYLIVWEGYGGLFDHPTWVNSHFNFKDYVNYDRKNSYSYIFYPGDLN
jgi:hypothetical protein